MSAALFPDNFKHQLFAVNDITINVRHGGVGSPLLLVHGYPQTMAMWHSVAAQLAKRFYVVCVDLRGYGDSAKPESTATHEPYSKRAMAQDLHEVMMQLGYESYAVAGHDRGARVAHRMALDFAPFITKVCVMDIAPTHHMFATTDQAFATAYYHWFFLIQPDGLPEKMIGQDPEFYLREKLNRWSAPGAQFNEQAVTEYVRCFSNEDAIHASCEDYRAAATIDLQHDEADMHCKTKCPLLVLWGQHGFVGRQYDVLAVWQQRATQVHGTTVNSGHFLPEEAPEEVVQQLTQFLLHA